MNLRNNQITVGELLSNPQAEALLRREFPSLFTPSLIRMARGMSLRQVLNYAGNIPREKISRVLRELEAI